MDINSDKNKISFESVNNCISSYNKLVLLTTGYWFNQSLKVFLLYDVTIPLD